MSTSQFLIILAAALQTSVAAALIYVALPYTKRAIERRIKAYTLPATIVGYFIVVAAAVVAIAGE